MHGFNLALKSICILTHFGFIKQATHCVSHLTSYGKNLFYSFFIRLDITLLEMFSSTCTKKPNSVFNSRCHVLCCKYHFFLYGNWKTQQLVTECFRYSKYLYLIRGLLRDVVRQEWQNSSTIRKEQFLTISMKRMLVWPINWVLAVKLEFLQSDGKFPGKKWLEGSAFRSSLSETQVLKICWQWGWGQENWPDLEMAWRTCFWVAEVKQERVVSFLCIDVNVMETETRALVLKLQNQTGILAMLDEECLRPGTVTDDTFLEKLNQVCATHQHFESRMSKCSRFLNDTSLPHSCFRIQHYAGKVRGEAGERVEGGVPAWSRGLVRWGGSLSVKRCCSSGGELLESIVDQKIQTCLHLFHFKSKIRDLGQRVFRDGAAVAEIKGSSPCSRAERCPRCFAGELLCCHVSGKKMPSRMTKIHTQLKARSFGKHVLCHWARGSPRSRWWESGGFGTCEGTEFILTACVFEWMEENATQGACKGACFSQCKQCEWIQVWQVLMHNSVWLFINEKSKSLNL